MVSVPKHSPFSKQTQGLVLRWVRVGANPQWGPWGSYQREACPGCTIGQTAPGEFWQLLQAPFSPRYPPLSRKEATGSKAPLGTSYLVPTLSQHTSALAAPTRVGVLSPRLLGQTKVCCSSHTPSPLSRGHCCPAGRPRPGPGGVTSLRGPSPPPSVGTQLERAERGPRRSSGSAGGEGSNM